MKRFSEFRVGDAFYSTCSISERELDEYLGFARIRNAFLEDKAHDGQLVSGRAIISRMEGEFTRLSQIYGNHLILVGSDGDPGWGNKSTRFLRPFHTDEVLRIKFTVSKKEDIDDEFGMIAVDYEGTSQDGEAVVVSKQNIYRIKKHPS